MPQPVFALDNTHDLYLGTNGLLSIASSTEDSLAQRIECRLKTFRGECFLDRSIGVPYYEEVFKKNPSVGRVRALLLSIVQEVPGVKEVLKFDVKFDPRLRVFQVDFRVKADDSTIIEGGI